MTNQEMELEEQHHNRGFIFLMGIGFRRSSRSQDILWSFFGFDGYEFTLLAEGINSPYREYPTGPLHSQIPKLYTWATNETWAIISANGLIAAIEASLVHMHGDISFFTSHLAAIKELIESFSTSTNQST